MEFSGFGKGAQQFFIDLAQNNQKTWFEANKSRYEVEVLEPALRLVEILGSKLATLRPGIHYEASAHGRGSIFRIHRDLRFSKDKTPYKTHLGVLFWLNLGLPKKDNPGFYLELNQAGVKLYAGLWELDKARLEAFRQSVTNPGPALELDKIFQALQTAGYETAQPYYKRPPKGFVAEHEAAGLLLYRALWAHKANLGAKVGQGNELVEETLRFYQSCFPLLDWVETHLFG